MDDFESYEVYMVFKVMWKWIDSKKMFNTKPGNTLNVSGQCDEAELAKETKKD